MSLKSAIASGVRRAASQPPLSLLLFRPDVRRTLVTLPGFQKLYGSGWDLIHPFDRQNGTQTSGFIPPEQLANSAFADACPHCYSGSQPSIVRSALAQLPNLAYFTFVDLGAGKGRPAMVASEFPLREVIGVELSPPLVMLARRNVAIYRRRHPDHAPIRIENMDAAMFRFPAGNLVVFLYNPFGEAVIKRVITHLEEALASERRSVFVIYYNPVFGACFDASPVFQRYHARTIAYAEDERGFGPDSADPIVIWQGGSSLPARVGADAPIRVVRPGERSELGDPCWKM